MLIEPRSFRADIARSEGFNVSELRVQLECVHVFGLSDTATSGADTGYFAARVGLQKFAAQVAAELGKQAAKGTAQITQTQAAKWLAEMIAKVASRLEIVITEKMAAQAAPVIGATAGVMLNTLFIDFYQDMARGHFIISWLALKYGEDAVQQAYAQVINSLNR